MISKTLGLAVFNLAYVMLVLAGARTDRSWNAGVAAMLSAVCRLRSALCRVLLAPAATVAPAAAAAYKKSGNAAAGAAAARAGHEEQP